MTQPLIKNGFFTTTAGLRLRCFLGASFCVGLLTNKAA
jgi:hypothetical protein